ncbi:sphinganine kinase lcb4 [Aspergillus hancockii]|nr:sphinganine kinase lcb4 [Aspergillus hancockii]
MSILSLNDHVSLVMNTDSLTILMAQRTQDILLANILWVEVSDVCLIIDYAEQKSTDAATVACVNFPIDQAQRSEAENWASALLGRAYRNAQRKRRMKVLINPFGGKGRANELYHKEVDPIFTAARCMIDVEKTKYSGHGTEIAQNIDINAYDVIVPCSGDGLVYEVFNGLAKKPDASTALSKIAIGHIPCGSGNAMSWNLYGTGSASLAALYIVKGVRIPLDLVSISQGDRRTLSFLSQSFGIIAESGLGTENIRWMGSARFTCGYLTLLMNKKIYPAELAVKVEIGDKQIIKKHYRSAVQKSPLDVDGLARSEPDCVGLPPLRYGSVQDEIPADWKLIPEDNLCYFYVGNMAYMAPDANIFPAALPNDGLVDLVTMSGQVSRMTAFQVLHAMSNGTLFDMAEIKVQKISGYRITPKGCKDGYISIDGERVPFESFQAEVHSGLGTVISRSGPRYETDGV